MKNLLLLLTLCHLSMFAGDPELPSEIKEVIVYLNGAQITRSATCILPAGTTEITLTGLSAKIDESSIQISGLESVSILSMAYNINYLSKVDNTSESMPLKRKTEDIDIRVARLKSTISGLEEEEQVIYANRTVGTRLQNLSLEKVKEISTYYRARITSIKNEVFMANLEINLLNEENRNINKQLAALNNLPEIEQGEIKIKFDAPVATKLDLMVSYQIAEAGWIPNYDIKSKDINAPLQLVYKAHVYQKTGNDWKDVKVILSTGNPNINVAKPHIGTKYLDFTNGYTNQPVIATQKHKYVYNPTVKQITGVVTDESGSPLPGANVMVNGTKNGTQTDFDGYFSLEVEGGESLSFSYLGFINKELPIYSSIINARLEEDSSALDEVVVTAYSTSRKRDITGAVTTLSDGQSLAGRAAGVNIRGMASGKDNRLIAPPNLPLYIIDGVPMEDFVEGDLDENEIQSVEVLKGERAISMYGSRGTNSVVVITTRKSIAQEEVTNTKFVINKPHSIPSNGDITAIEINTFQLKAQYEYYAAPIVNENVFLTTIFNDWEQYQLLPGEASIYFKGSYAGKTTIDPYTTKKEMVVSLGIDPNITVTRKQNKDFKSKSFTGSNRILDRTYDIEVKNNKSITIDLKLMDRIPISQQKEIKVDDIIYHDADYDDKKGLLSWSLHLGSQESQVKSFSFQVKYPRYRSISL